MPDKSTVLRWLGDEENLEFRDRYARAREMQADVLFDEVLEIADDTSGDWSEDDDGRRIFDHEHVQRSRLRVDARKWAAGKLAPKRYDTKDRPITFDLPDIESSDDLVKAMAAVLVAVSVGNITLAEGQAFAGLIDVHRRAIEAVDLDRRVNALEERLGNPK